MAVLGILLLSHTYTTKSNIESENKLHRHHVIKVSHFCFGFGAKHVA